MKIKQKLILTFLFGAMMFILSGCGYESEITVDMSNYASGNGYTGYLNEKYYVTPTELQIYATMKGLDYNSLVSQCTQVTKNDKSYYMYTNAKDLSSSDLAKIFSTTDGGNYVSRKNTAGFFVDLDGYDETSVYSSRLNYSKITNFMQFPMQGAITDLDFGTVEVIFKNNSIESTNGSFVNESYRGLGYSTGAKFSVDDIRNNKFTRGYLYMINGSDIESRGSNFEVSGTTDSGTTTRYAKKTSTYAVSSKTVKLNVDGLLPTDFKITKNGSPYTIDSTSYDGSISNGMNIWLLKGVGTYNLTWSSGNGLGNTIYWTYTVKLTGSGDATDYGSSVVLNVENSAKYYTRSYFKVKASDDSGLSYIRLNGATIKNNYKIKSSGTYTLKVKASDGQTKTVKFRVYVDNSKPNVNVESKKTYRVKGYYKLKASDSNSGVASVTLTNLTTGQSTTITSTYKIRESGSYKVQITDRCGNTTTKSFKVKVK